MTSATEGAKELLRLARRLDAAQAKSDRASGARMSLPPGSSRARVTTANARWAQAAEARDRCARAFHEQLARLSSEVMHGR